MQVYLQASRYLPGTRKKTAQCHQPKILLHAASNINKNWMSALKAWTCGQLNCRKPIFLLFHCSLTILRKF
jgi:hypothetical protein